ncbi:TPA: type IV conjugative transfer system lipoprotein TraV [Escherichia coli]|nr:type IV conjugative transfer system lipoprotein TraV [Escherichia coli]
MYFSAEPAQIAEIKRLASGAVTPFYRRATNEGIQLFLAGSAGLLQTTEDVRFEPCPGLSAAGRGVVSTENIAFTRWLTLLQDSVLLDEQNCLMLHELWLQSGTGQRRWEGLPDDARETITVHFTAKRGDWCDIWGTCMTMEQANEKAKKLEQSSEAKPVAASLPRLAEGNFRTMPVQTVTATTPSGSRPAVTAHPEQKLLAPRPLFTAAREVKTVVPVSSVTPVTPPRPLRTGEQTAALWIAPYIDNQDVYHQPSSVFFVIKPSAWGKPRIN